MLNPISIRFLVSYQLSGSFGTFPRAIREKQREYLDRCEATPDPFIRYEYPALLDMSRGAVSKVLNAPVSTVVYVPNATNGVNTVLRNLMWNRDGKDEILYFNTIYGACGKTVDYVCEASHDVVQAREMHVTYPMEDEDLLKVFKDAIKASRAEGKTPRIAIFDTVSSLPGVRMPFESLTAICKEESILSLIDGAHGVGHVSLDLSALDPDFFVSNCHKWLFVPRGVAVFYVPERNQHIIRSTLPTSHGFVPRSGGAVGTVNPLPVGNNSAYVQNFEFVGTIDNTNYLVIPEAIKWREEVCGGEKAIMEYNMKLAKKGGNLVANILGTEIMDNSTHTLTDCCLVNIRLPLKASPTKIPGVNTVDLQHGFTATQWMQKKLIEEHNTFIVIYFFQNQWWTRLSGQVYLDMSDFEWAGQKLKEICERAGKENFDRAKL
jgi:selenocysteine lyase/cysteine desulfurase